MFNINLHRTRIMNVPWNDNISGCVYMDSSWHDAGQFDLLHSTAIWPILHSTAIWPILHSTAIWPILHAFYRSSSCSRLWVSQYNEQDCPLLTLTKTYCVLFHLYSAVIVLLLHWFINVLYRNCNIILCSLSQSYENKSNYEKLYNFILFGCLSVWMS